MKRYNKPTMQVFELKCTCLQSGSPTDSGPFSGSGVHTPGIGSRSCSFDDEDDDF